METPASIAQISKFMPVEHISRDAMRKLGSRRIESYYRPLDTIIMEADFNVRISSPERDEHINRLADLILEHGYDAGKPLTGFFKADGLFVITDGHCRREAVNIAISKGAPIEELPCFPEAKSFSDEDRTLTLITRNQGKELTPVEVSDVLKRLKSFGWDDNKIAKRIGRSITYVNSMLSLAGAPAQVREMVVTRQVSASLAVEVMKKEGSAQAIETLTAAIAEAGERGKDKATPKSVRTVKEREESADGEGAKPLAAKKTPAVAQFKSLAKGGNTDWSVWGPRLKKALDGILAADSQETLELCISQAKDMTRNF